MNIRLLSIALCGTTACGPTAGTGTGTSTGTGTAATSEASDGGATSLPTSTTATGTGTSTGMPSSSTTAPTPTSGDPTCPSFICDDQGSAGGACDLYAQDCPEGEKCAPVITDGGGDWNAFICVPVSGTDMPGDPCIAESSADGLDSCEKGGIVLGCRHGRQRHLCRAMHRFS